MIESLPAEKGPRKPEKSPPARHQGSTSGLRVCGWAACVDPRGNLGEKQEQKPDSEKGSSINVNSKTSLHRNQMKYVFEKAKNVFSPEN